MWNLLADLLANVAGQFEDALLMATWTNTTRFA
jgi:hypothetical protein